mmetsp:Transcript_31144/g.61161  ORF Transcript_31144/g.61161 Transcript_31144/m.61161 type:complete len:371 (+) Transcript_31144:83-1195(+)
MSEDPRVMPWQNSMPGREHETAMHQSWQGDEAAAATHQTWSGHPMSDASRGDWQCPNTQCVNHTNYPASYVYGSSVNCKKCGTGKAAQRPGDWCCPNPQCINHRNCVYGSKSVCPKCGCPRPPLNMGKANPAGQAWCPPVSSATTVKAESNGSYPTGAGGAGSYAHANHSMPPRGAPVPRHGDWHCPNPACKNHTGNVVYASKTICPICGMAKPEDPEVPDVPAPPTTPPPASVRRLPMRMVQQPPPVAAPQAPKAKGRETRPGDWNCTNPGCKNFADNVVYGSKTHCPLCNAPRPLSSITPTTPSGPMDIRPGDWHCPNPVCKNHTHNVVYAAKPSCPLCGTRNPIDVGQDASYDGGVYLRRARSRSPV